MISFACPGCGLSFSVEDDKAGKAGKCPQCSALFEIPGVELPANPEESPSANEVEIKPCPDCHTRLAVAVGDLGQDVKCPHCNQVYAAERSIDSPSAHQFDDDEVASGRSRRRRIYAEPDRGATDLTLVLIGFMCCPLLTIIGTVMATDDLKKMKTGIMDPEGKGLTQAAQIVGFISIGLNVLTFLFYGVMMLVG